MTFYLCLLTEYPLIRENDKMRAKINNLINAVENLLQVVLNNIVTTIVLCQHRTIINRATLINIVNSTSVVEP